MSDIMEKISQAQDVISHIEETYPSFAEYLFESTDTAVFRKGTKKKWFAVVMHISRKTLGTESDEKIDVLNVKLNPDDIALLIDQKGYFPAYHMNKKHWCTIVLDGTLDIDEICYRIEQSYYLVKG